ncbi:hypothetical protein KPH14_002659 [Odynerus spinipes]|uniref:HTH iclR-type domain-containing protein n=1 Tax=Odynerus spinipes TaxID=1348599 RepID=A0AAD9VMS0_9HYME|nr:hypothetical protein KPH14_002659 [Odynerus spinipes]
MLLQDCMLKRHHADTIHKQEAQRNEANKNAVLAAVTANPQISISRIARNMGIHRSSVHRILQSHKFHPYHVNLVHDLHGEDFNSRIRSCNWFNEKINEDPQFFTRVLFSDEAIFKSDGSVNRHNMHYWSQNNPHWMRAVDHQRIWSLNTWCGILNTQSRD